MSVNVFRSDFTFINFNTWKKTLLASNLGFCPAISVNILALEGSRTATIKNKIQSFSG